MKITDLLSEKGILLNAAPKSKADAIDSLVNLMDSTGVLTDKEAYKNAVLAREDEGTTGIGEGIAIPHAKTQVVKKPQLVAMVVPGGVDYQSLDGEPAKLFFLIAAPDTKDNVHLDVLSRLSAMLMNPQFTEDLIAAKSAGEFLNIVNSAEDEKLSDSKTADIADEGDVLILGVTACPTGIAHTYMAEEALLTAGKNAGVTIKVETDGSGGVKNALTDDEIARAKCIIVAADKNVEMARFDGKPVIITKVSDGIHKASVLVERAKNADAPVYRAKDDEKAQKSEGGKESIGRQIYKHLMNGVSHMLPFVIGGGILIALSFLFDIGNTGSTLGSGNGFSKFLNIVGNGAFSFMLPILAGFIAYSIADRPGLAVGMVGGFMATQTDMHAYSKWLQTDSNPGFLGALAAGFAAGYIVVFLRWATHKLPRSLDGIRPTLIYPFFGILLIGALMYFGVNAPFGLINKGITWVFNSLNGVSGVLLGFVLAAMMAFDMGGPLNKAAYVFGTASVAINPSIMASVMIGGMVPPLAIALATNLFPQKFTKKERVDGKVNYLMGMAFITEGAIPYAAADPLRVIPACAVGSGVAGALSMLFKCTLPAPHGGIFVIAVIGHWYWFLLALAIGTVVGALMLALLKKDAPNPELGKFKGLFNFKSKKNKGE